MGSALTMNMQIIIFSVYIDKFTGFFDKYLTANGKDIEGVTDIISVGYENGFRQKMNNFSKIIEQKKFFCTPHFPAAPRSSPLPLPSCSKDSPA